MSKKTTAIVIGILLVMLVGFIRYEKHHDARRAAESEAFFNWERGAVQAEVDAHRNGTLNRCPRCRNIRSQHAMSCPHCGEPVPWNQPNPYKRN
jgi:hypothetical protein